MFTLASMMMIFRNAYSHLTTHNTTPPPIVLLLISLSLFFTCSSTAYRKINKYKKHKICRKLNTKGATKCFVWNQFEDRSSSSLSSYILFRFNYTTMNICWNFVAFTDWCLKTTTTRRNVKNQEQQQQQHSYTPKTRSKKGKLYIDIYLHI